jgi:3-deoxy-D-manno-octulosonic-acid transferase
MENFRDMSRTFLEAGAAVQIHDDAELVPAIDRLLENPHLAAELGKRGRLIVDENSGATDRVLRFLLPAGVIQ